MDFSLLDGQIADATKDLNSLPHKRAERVRDMLERMEPVGYDMPIEIIQEIIENPDYTKWERPSKKAEAAVDYASKNQNARGEDGHPINENALRASWGDIEAQKRQVIHAAVARYNATVSDEKQIGPGAGDALLEALNKTIPAKVPPPLNKDLAKESGYLR